MINLSNWLRKTPQPAAVLADDKRIEMPKNARAIRDLTQTIKALEPSKVTCLDASGNIIRSIVLDAADDEKQASANASPDMSDLQMFARLLAEGYEHGRKANQPIIDSAMQFVERQSVRLAKAESEIDRLRAIIHKQHLQIADLTVGPDAPAGTDDSLLGTLMAGALQGAAQASGVSTQVTPIKPAPGAAKK